jgi:putative MATE family efflux protein
MHDMTTGRIRGHLLRMAAFMLIGMVVQILYSLIDMYWVGRLGKEAVAAVGLCGNLQIAVMALQQILSVGTGSIVAHAAGRKALPEVKRYFNQSMVFGVLMGLVLGVVMFATLDDYARELASDEDTAQKVRQFLMFFIPALVLQFPLAAVGAALRGIGDMRAMLMTQLGTVILNMIMAPFLIFGWVTHMPFGVAGGALSTLIAIAIGNVGLLMHVHRRGNCFDPLLRDWLPDFAVWRRILSIGLPSGAEFGILTVYMFFVMLIIKPFGADAQAAFSIGSRLLQAGMMVAMSIALASASVAGQNYGARQAARVRETFAETLKISVCSVVAFFVLFQLFPDPAFHMFTRDPAVILIGEDYLRVIAWNLLASGVVMACFGMFTAFGNTVPSLIGSATRITLVVIPIWLLSQRPDFQLHWVWLLSAASTVMQMALNLWFLRREFRKRLAFPAPVDAAPVAVGS